MMSCARSLQSLAAPVSGRRCVVARGLVDDVKQTIKPRVNELRRQQLSQGAKGLGDVMNFTGPAPELVNGRLAMVGFLAAVSAECVNQGTIFQQFQEATGSVLAFSAVVAIASIIPIVRGSSVLDDGAGEGVRIGSFNVTNELINGRAAMLGLAILISYEAIAGTALF